MLFAVSSLTRPSRPTSIHPRLSCKGRTFASLSTTEFWEYGFLHDEKREKSAIAYGDIYKSSLPGAGKYVVVTHDWRFYNLL
jgi:hypothetical protein